MTAMISVPNAAVLIVPLIRTARSVLIGVGRKWRPMLNMKAKDIKVKDSLPWPPSDASVPSAQSVVASGDDVDHCIA